MYDIDNTFDVKLLNLGGNAVLPIDIHDFADAADHCVLVDKTMFIADILDCESTVALCCRPHGFGKSMNLSMLKCYLERPVPGSSNVNLFTGSKIWDAEDDIYRDEYARYPVIALDFSAPPIEAPMPRPPCAMPSLVSALVCCPCWTFPI